MRKIIFTFFSLALSLSANFASADFFQDELLSRNSIAEERRLELGYSACGGHVFLRAEGSCSLCQITLVTCPPDP